MDLDRFADRLIRALAESKDWPTARERISKFATLEHTWNTGSSLFDQIWEHPEVVKHEKSLKDKKGHYKGASIMGSFFYTLYQIKSEYENESYAQKMPFMFTFGRLGNTASYYIRPKTAEERGQLRLAGLGGKRRHARKNSGIGKVHHELKSLLLR